MSPVLEHIRIVVTDEAVLLLPKDDPSQSLRIGFDSVHPELIRPYLIGINQRTALGSLHGVTVYKVQDVILVPLFSASASVLAAAKAESSYRDRLRQILSTWFLFCYGHQLHHTSQRLVALHAAAAAPPWMLADNRFFWNKLLASPFITAGLDAWVLPLLAGHFSTATVDVEGVSLTLTLISRRARYRAGLRYYVRGADADGHVANHVETEMLVAANGWLASHVQVRGSVPLHWHQRSMRRGSLSYNPKPRIEGDLSVNAATMARHFDDLRKYYGFITCVSLLETGEKRRENSLAQCFRRVLSELHLSDVHLLSWDFHRHCHKGHFERIAALMELLREELLTYGFFVSDSQLRIARQVQCGVLRTNCLDCLDRTNVVQTSVARMMLPLLIAAVAPSVAPAAATLALDSAFNNMWADNGDAVSVQYAGTVALKRDFTRTGKRTAGGVVSDGINSLTRFYVNNFVDEEKQLLVDAMLGKVWLDHSFDRRAEALMSPSERSLVDECRRAILRRIEDPTERAVSGALVLPALAAFSAWPLLSVCGDTVILVLTTKAYYRAVVDTDGAVVRECVRTPLLQLRGAKISQHEIAGSPPTLCLRLYYREWDKPAAAPFSARSLSSAAARPAWAFASEAPSSAEAERARGQPLPSIASPAAAAITSAAEGAAGAPSEERERNLAAVDAVGHAPDRARPPAAPAPAATPSAAAVSASGTDAARQPVAASSRPSIPLAAHADDRSSGSSASDAEDGSDDSDDSDSESERSLTSASESEATAAMVSAGLRAAAAAARPVDRPETQPALLPQLEQQQARPRSVSAAAASIPAAMARDTMRDPCAAGPTRPAGAPAAAAAHIREACELPGLPEHVSPRKDLQRAAQAKLSLFSGSHAFPVPGTVSPLPSSPAPSRTHASLSASAALGAIGIASDVASSAAVPTAAPSLPAAAASPVAGTVSSAEASASHAADTSSRFQTLLVHSSPTQSTPLSILVDLEPAEGDASASCAPGHDGPAFVPAQVRSRSALLAGAAMAAGLAMSGAPAAAVPSDARSCTYLPPRSVAQQGPDAQRALLSEIVDAFSVAISCAYVDAQAADRVQALQIAESLRSTGQTLRTGGARLTEKLEAVLSSGVSQVVDRFGALFRGGKLGRMRSFSEQHPR